MASDDEVAVFTDTNLGTHLGMAVSPNTTVADFQRELERTHHSCFPELGEIKVHALMYAFKHLVGSWFLHIEARTLKDSGGPCLSNFAAIEVGDRKCDGNNLTDSLVRNIGEGTIINRDAAEWNSSLMTKNPTNISLGTISAAGIIEGCLLNCNGVSQPAGSPGSCGAIQGLPEEQPRTKPHDYCSSIQIGGSPPFMVRTPSKQSSFLSPADRTTGIPRDKFISSEIGKRIIIASNNIRISDKRRPLTTLTKFRDRRLLCYKNLYRAKFLVFEISDSDSDD